MMQPDCNDDSRFEARIHRLELSNRRMRLGLMLVCAAIGCRLLMGATSAPAEDDGIFRVPIIETGSLVVKEANGNGAVGIDGKQIRFWPNGKEQRLSLDDHSLRFYDEKGIQRLIVAGSSESGPRLPMIALAGRDGQPRAMMSLWGEDNPMITVGAKQKTAAASLAANDDSASIGVQDGKNRVRVGMTFGDEESKVYVQDKNGRLLGTLPR